MKLLKMFDEFKCRMNRLLRKSIYKDVLIFIIDFQKVGVIYIRIF